MSFAEETEDMFAMLERLRVSEQEDEQNQCLDRILKFLIDNEDDYGLNEALETSVDNGMLSDLYGLVNKSNGETLCKVVQILPEIAKIETIREPCVAQGFIPILLHLLTSSDVTLATQACRALGNICYDNDAGRNAVEKENGINVLLTLLRSCLKSEETGSEQLRYVACGFLLNLVNTHDELMQRALEDGAIDVLNDFLQTHQDDHRLCNMALLTIEVFTDSEQCAEKMMNTSVCTTVVSLLESEATQIHLERIFELFIIFSEWEQCKDKIFNSSLCTTIINLLDSENGDILEQKILEIFINLCKWESDEVKDILAETSLSNHLIRIIQSNTGKLDSDSQQTIKLASDLLVLLLNGDKVMEKMFEGGNGPLYVETVKWLESENTHLQLSAILAIGNFARNDSHCKRIVEDSIVDTLLEILKKYTDNQTDMTYQHAILSALKNLAIPVANKPVLLMSGVMEAVVAIMSTEIMAVVHRLVGVLRMLVDGQETAAVQLGNDLRFVERLTGWCDVYEHACVPGESARLLASLIKNSKSVQVMQNIIRAQGLPHIVSMLQSKHVEMQNEGLVALTLICSTVLSEAALQLKEADLIDTVMGLLSDEKTRPEIMCNTFSLIKAVYLAVSTPDHQILQCSILACTGLRSETQSTMKEEMNSSGIIDVTRLLSEQHKDDNVRGAAAATLLVIEENPIDR